jgi:hypothetical protein
VRFLAGLPYGIACDRLPRQIARKQPHYRMGGFPVGTQLIEQTRREHHIAIFSAPALIDPQHHLLAVDVGLPSNSQESPAT